MIKYFSVKNFKNFDEEICLDFSDTRNYNFNTYCIKNDLLKDIIIYGKNASGKSNLGLAFFDIIYHLTENKRNVSLYSNYLNVSSNENEATFYYVFSFDNYEVKYRYKKTDLEELTYEEMIINNELIFSYDFRNQTGTFDGVKEKITDTLNMKGIFTISILKYIGSNSILADDSPIRILLNFVKNMIWFRSIGSNQYVGNELGETSISNYILKNKLIDDFESFLCRCGINEKLVVQRDPTGKEVIYVKKENGNKLMPFYSCASSGTIALSMFYIWFSSIKDLSFIWIDEFDAFYHYELSEAIVKLLENQSNCQAILASHNTNLLSNRIMRPDTYFILSGGKLTSLCNATDRELREGHNLEKLYLNGEFDREKSSGNC